MSYEEAMAIVFRWKYPSEADKASFFYNMISVYYKINSNDRDQLRDLWPEVFQALEDWEMAGDSGDDLFRKHGLM